MPPTIAAVSTAIDSSRDPCQRALLLELAESLLRLRLLQRDAGRVAAVLCRMRLDSARTGGEDDRRDAAAA